MTSEQFQRVKELFAALEPLSKKERQRTLEATSGDDSVVRVEVEKLLERSDEVHGHPGTVAQETDSILATVRVGPCAMTGERVGPYQVIEILGQGGISTSEFPGIPPAAAIVVRTGGSGPKRPWKTSFIPA